MSYTFTLKRIWTWKQYICFLDYMYMHWYLEAFCMFSFGWGDDSTWYVSKGLKSQPRCFSSCLTYWMMLHAMLPEMVCLWKGKKYRYSFNSCPFYTFSFSELVFALDLLQANDPLKDPDFTTSGAKVVDSHSYATGPVWGLWDTCGAHSTPWFKLCIVCIFIYVYIYTYWTSESLETVILMLSTYRSNSVFCWFSHIIGDEISGD